MVKIPEKLVIITNIIKFLKGQINLLYLDCFLFNILVISVLKIGYDELHDRFISNSILFFKYLNQLIGLKSLF